MEGIELNNNIENNLNIGREQKSFLETTIGKTINGGLNIGLRYLLPDLIEDQVIKIKDILLKEGFKSGVKEAIDSAINFGKSAIGIVTGNFENVEQVQNAIKSGVIIDSVSNVLNSTINKAVVKGSIPYGVGGIIKQGKNVILGEITKNIEGELENQSNGVELLGKYINQWKEYYNNKNFDGMEREYQKINSKLKEIIPIENTIKEARNIENLHILIKNRGQNFDISNEEKELAKIL